MNKFIEISQSGAGTTLLNLAHIIKIHGASDHTMLYTIEGGSYRDSRVLYTFLQALNEANN